MSKKSVEARLDELEKRAWKMLVHEAAAAQRENLDMPSEADGLLDYFEEHGVPALDVNATGKTVRSRVDPHRLWSFTA